MNDPENGDENIVLTITKAESLVLFDFLARYSETDKLEIHDQAEEKVLWSILGDLEKTLTEPLNQNYQNIIRRARDEIRDTAISIEPETPGTSII